MATIKDRAYVAPSARVRYSAVVKDDARIEDEAGIGGQAEVGGRARIAGRASVCGRARVEGDARVDGDADVRHTAVIRGTARIGGTAQILGGVWDGSEGPIMEGCWFSPTSRSRVQSVRPGSHELVRVDQDWPPSLTPEQWAADARVNKAVAAINAGKRTTT